MTASGRSFSIDAKAFSSSSLLLILTGLIVVPVASPPSFICSRKGLEKGSVALARAVTRRADGSMSRINWTLLPASPAATLAMPVTFPPGRGRLMTRPVPIGSPVSAITIGISRVACFAATAVGVNQSDDDIDLETNQLSCQFGKPVDLSFRRPKLKSNVLPLDIPQIAESLPKLPPEFFRAYIAN